MGKRVSCGLMTVLGILAGACTTTSGDPTREDTARYFGLEDGRTVTYQVDNGGVMETRTFTYKKNNSFADRLAYTMEERTQAGTIPTDGTLVFGAELFEILVVRSGDCLPNCTDYLNPPKVMDNPIQPNGSLETVTNTRVNTGAGSAPGPQERHTFTTGGEAQLTTPAGTFKVLQVVWRIFPEGGGPSVDTQFYFAPNKGIIQWQKGNRVYKVSSGISP